MSPRPWTAALAALLAAAALTACSDDEPGDETGPDESSGRVSAPETTAADPDDDATEDDTADASADPTPDATDESGCSLPGVDALVEDSFGGAVDLGVAFVDDEELAGTPVYAGYVDAQSVARAGGGDFCLWTGQGSIVTVLGYTLDQAGSQERNSALVDFIEDETAVRVEGLGDLAAWWVDDANALTGDPFKQLEATHGLRYANVGVGWAVEEFGDDPFSVDVLERMAGQVFHSIG